ncbi:hypothetical protein EV424DRAFT_1541407 [Suillus variegatus]|nr:hypothetical protein EV424DRAFT_1541407 [Suillus variegatus]
MPYYDPDKSSDHSSRSSGYNDSAAQILGGGDSPRIRLRFPACGQGAPADSEGNYDYNKIYPEYQPPGLNTQETLDSAKLRSPSSKAHSISAGDEVPDQYQRAWSTFEFSQHTRHLIAPQFIPRTTIFRENSIRADPVEQHGMSPILEAVSHTDMLSFALRRFKDKPFRRSSSPTKISDITALS